MRSPLGELLAGYLPMLERQSPAGNGNFGGSGMGADKATLDLDFVCNLSQLQETMNVR
jgi:hypothetical protein